MATLAGAVRACCRCGPHSRSRGRRGDRRQPQEHRDAAWPAAGGRSGRRARLRRAGHHPPVEEFQLTRPLDRVTGSVAFGAVARVVLATVKAADPNAPRRLVRAKSNLGPDTGGFAYTLIGAPVPGHNFHAQAVEWGEPLEGSARELMAIEDPEGAATAAVRGAGVSGRHAGGRAGDDRSSFARRRTRTVTPGARFSASRTISASSPPRPASRAPGRGGCPSRRAPSPAAKDANMIELGGLRADAEEMGLYHCSLPKNAKSAGVGVLRG